MTDLYAAAADYLAIRRKLGFSFKRPGWLLPDFVAYMDSVGANVVTIE